MWAVGIGDVVPRDPQAAGEPTAPAIDPRNGESTTVRREDRPSAGTRDDEVRRALATTTSRAHPGVVAKDDSDTTATDAAAAIVRVLDAGERSGGGERDQVS